MKRMIRMFPTSEGECPSFDDDDKSSCDESVSRERDGDVRGCGTPNVVDDPEALFDMAKTPRGLFVSSAAKKNEFEFV